MQVSKCQPLPPALCMNEVRSSKSSKRAPAAIALFPLCFLGRLPSCFGFAPASLGGEGGANCYSDAASRMKGDNENLCWPAPKASCHK
jgi:hypothetical protein